MSFSTHRLLKLRLSGLALVAAFGALSTPARADGIVKLVSSVVEKYVAERAFPGAADKAPVLPVSLPAAGSFADCTDQFPSGRVVPATTFESRLRASALCSSSFAVVYSAVTKTPLVVIERLNANRLDAARDEPRSPEFFEDPRLAGTVRARLSDYAGTGFDRGHMAPAADMPDQGAMLQSFVLTNIVPQDPHNNRKVWSKVESDTRKFARRAGGNVFVYTGPLFEGKLQTIGAGKVWVPSHLFKLVYDEGSGRVWAHILENSAQAQIAPPVSYADFVARTGLKLLGEPMPARVASAARP